MQMRWKKHGLIFASKDSPLWGCNGALTPTPFKLSEDIIRVFCGFRDQEGISRIGYVDISSNDPTNILHVSKQPILDIGRPGCFDDNGVILGDVVRAPDGSIRMYYVGFQLVNKVKFLAFTGLACSENGQTFSRFSEAPILDRSDGANMIKAVHTARFENGRWRIWYAAGDDWQIINNVAYPKYNIWHSASRDGISFDIGNASESLCVDNEGNEYRIGRPSVYFRENRYTMLYTKGTTEGSDYFPGIAFSDDGISWIRDDSKLGVKLGDTGEFDCLHLCYPRLFEAKGRTWAVYNGNDMGKEGFGLMELIK